MGTKKKKPHYPNRIYEHRKAAGTTQAQLQAAIGLSPTSGYIGNLERGDTPLPTDHPWRLRSIARALGVADWQLFAASRGSTQNISVFPANTDG